MKKIAASLRFMDEVGRLAASTFVVYHPFIGQPLHQVILAHVGQSYVAVAVLYFI